MASDAVSKRSSQNKNKKFMILAVAIGTALLLFLVIFFLSRPSPSSSSVSSKSFGKFVPSDKTTGEAEAEAEAEAETQVETEKKEQHKEMEIQLREKLAEAEARAANAEQRLEELQEKMKKVDLEGARSAASRETSTGSKSGTGTEIGTGTRTETGTGTGIGKEDEKRLVHDLHVADADQAIREPIIHDPSSSLSSDHNPSKVNALFWPAAHIHPPADDSKYPFAIISAWKGDRYRVMASLSSETKAKYAGYHGYAYFDESELLADTTTFQQMSNHRIQAFRKHWDTAHWLVWCDADVLITNPAIEMTRIVETYAPSSSGKHVIMSKDWGGRQVNPGVTFLRTSSQGKQFLDAWDEAIQNNDIQDDLLAIRDDLEKNQHPTMKYVVFTAQQVINSYPHLTLKFGKYNDKTPEHDKSHHLWQQNDFMVHVVNCLRQYYAIEEAACNGMAAYYFVEFRDRLEALIRSSRSDIAIQHIPLWMKSYSADLCLV